MLINSIQNNSFKGVYVSKAMAVGKQYNVAQEVANAFRKSGFASGLEKLNQDVLILPSKKGEGVDVVVKKLNLKRILNDDFSRWNGAF